MYRRILVTWLILVGVLQLSFGQVIPDFSSINIADLSNQQIQNFVRRASAQGYSQDQLIQLAQLQGLPADQLSVLSKRLEDLSSNRAIEGNEQPLKRDSRELSNPDVDPLFEQLFRLPDTSTGSRVFGASFFRQNLNLSFESNLNRMPPSDYRLGPQDQVYIDIYGESEQYYEAVISPEGNVLLSNIGPIYLAGLTLTQAKQRVLGKLIRTYESLGGANPKSFLNVSLGNIRSIQVNIVGEVVMPGTYTLTSLSTAFNALYAAGGIKDNGTFRSVRLFRDNKLLQEVDLYEFLINGVVEGNERLEDGDAIIVDPYTNRVEVLGEVKRSGIFEIKPDETLADLLKYAGGFSENAFKETISLTRNTNKEKIFSDIYLSQLEIIKPQAGDVYNVRPILNRFENRVQIEGAVFRPGTYALSSSKTLKGLIDASGGITGDALLSRGFITRVELDRTLTTIPFQLDQILKGESSDVLLQREDIVSVVSSLNLQEEKIVEVKGEVNKPGAFSFLEGMTLEEAVIRAGGFQETAMTQEIEVLRRTVSNNGESSSKIILANLDPSFDASSQDLLLEPFDRINIRRKKGDFVPGSIAVEGEISFPGTYGLMTDQDRVSDVLQRAGALKTSANISGATLIRRTEVFDPPSENQQRIIGLKDVLSRLDSVVGSLSEAQVLQRGRLIQEIADLEKYDDGNQQFSSFVKTQRLREIGERNSLGSGFQVGQAEAIAIDLNKILATPGSIDDLILEDGDVIVIPKKSQTVRLRGKVLYPTTVRFSENRSAKYFIDQAGGFDSRAKRGKTYVIYPNGSVAKTRRFLFFKTYPKVEPGSEIIVPDKGVKLQLRTQEIIAISSGIATLALVISQIDFSKSTN